MTFEQQTAVFEAACKRHADKIEGMALNSAQREAYALDSRTVWSSYSPEHDVTPATVASHRSPVGVMLAGLLRRPCFPAGATSNPESSPLPFLTRATRRKYEGYKSLTVS